MAVSQDWEFVSLLRPVWLVKAMSIAMHLICLPLSWSFYLLVPSGSSCCVEPLVYNKGKHVGVFLTFS